MTSSHLLLPEDYTPCDRTVIIGRGKQVHNHPGNLHYQQVLKENLYSYTHEAGTRSAKGAIIRKVIDEIRSESHGGYGFVKQDSKTGKWTVLEDIAARTSVSQAFRDLIHGKVRTSSSRQAQQQAQQQARRTNSSSHNVTANTVAAPVRVPSPAMARASVTVNANANVNAQPVLSSSASSNKNNVVNYDAGAAWNQVQPNWSVNSLQGFMTQEMFSTAPSHELAPRKDQLDEPCPILQCSMDYCDDDKTLLQKFLQMMPEQTPQDVNPFEPEPLPEATKPNLDLDAFLWDQGFFSMG